MDVQTFQTSVSHSAPPKDTGLALQALWYLEKGDWPEAHRRAQAQDDVMGAWVHAHLHRVEGDNANAGYWYNRAGKPASAAPLADEWREIAVALLR